MKKIFVILKKKNAGDDKILTILTNFGQSKVFLYFNKNNHHF